MRNRAVIQRQLGAWHFAGLGEDRGAAAVAGVDRHLLVRIIDVAGGVVVVVAAVGGVPLIGAGSIGADGRNAGRRGGGGGAEARPEERGGGSGAIRRD